MKRIMCYGDSNTWGFNPKTRFRYDENTRWTKLIQKELGNEYEIIEEGLCGRTFCFNDPSTPTRNGMDHLQMLLETHIPLDLVIIMLGTNDMKTINNASCKAISRGLRTTLRTIKNPYTYDGYHVPKILVISPVKIGDNYQSAVDTIETFNEESYQKSQKLAEYLEKMAKEYDCDFIDASKYAKSGSYDAIHLDEENHKLLSIVIKDKVSEILRGK